MPEPGAAALPNEDVQETQFTEEQPFEGNTHSGNTASSYGTIHNGHQSDEAGNQPKLSSPSSTARALSPDLLRGLLMALQAIDHSALSVGAWRHGTAIETETDGTNVHEWNGHVPFIARTLTHLCAPGFMFLLGMGVVYFGRSRSKLGWTTYQMVSHFFVRGLVLALVNEALGLVIGRGKFIVFNIVLLALAINYFLAGLLWLAINATEPALAKLLDGALSTNSNDDDSVSRPLLNDQSETQTPKTGSSRAVEASWHVHNVVLLALSGNTIWWNVWLSPDHGHCQVESSLNAMAARKASSSMETFLDFWFYSLNSPRVISGFPPLAWIGFAILGLLTSRIILFRSRSQWTVNAGYLSAGVVLMLLFVLTRIFHFGNLSEGCLHMPEHIANPQKNQYLASVRSFFYITKYPPSPSFAFFTMSVNFFLLALFASLPTKIARNIPLLMTFGTSALFFYIAHLLLYFTAGYFIKMWFGHKMGYDDPMKGGEAIGVGDSPAFWITYVLGLLILYPLCRWYGRFKSAKGPNSLWRFF